MVRLRGRSLTGLGFLRDFDQRIILRTSCVSAWCASAPDLGAEVLAAVKHQGDELLLEVSPCPSNALAVSADDEARVLNCHRFRNCALAE